MTTEVRLGEVVAIVARQLNPRLPQYASLPLINGENIESGTTRLLFRRTAGSVSAISPKYEVAVGDVVYSKLRPYLRKVVVADVPGLCSADLYPLRPDTKRVDPQWLAWLLVSEQFTTYAAQSSARARMPKLNRDELLSYSFLLPPLAEQRRIRHQLGEQIDAARAMGTSGVAARGPVIALRNQIRDDAVALPNAEKVPLGQVLTLPGAIIDGPFGSNLKGDHYKTSGVRVIRLGNIGVGRFIDVDRAYVTKEHAARLGRHAAAPGDLVVAALGDGERPAGRACVVPDELDESIVKADCFRIKTNGSGLDAHYLMHYMNSTSVLRKVAASSRGATRPRMTLAILKQIEVPLPQLDTQRRIAAEVEGRLASVDSVTAAIGATLEAIAALPAALIRLAFNDLAA